MADFTTMAAFTTNVVGEGTYGCVLRPPLVCSRDQDVDGRPVDYTGKVSKLMEIDHATEEQAKYYDMEEIDPGHLFHYPTPMRCFLPTNPSDGKFTDEVQDRIKQCQLHKEILDNLDNYQVLLMQDGGHDLLGFADDVLKKVRTIHAKYRWSSSESAISKETELLQQVNRLKRFWENVIILFYGLQRLKDMGGWVHNDLKPQNVVYLEEENRVAMIDFGMLQQTMDIAQAANANTYIFARFHWNFPPEMFFYDRQRFTEMQRLSKTERKEIYNSATSGYQRVVKYNLRRTKTMREEIDGAYHDYEYNESLRSLAKVLGLGKENISIISDRFLREFIENVPRKVPFEDFIQTSISTLDVYGLGVSLQFTINRIGNLNDRSLGKLNADLTDLFVKMWDSNLYGRIDIDQAVVSYRAILHKHGIQVQDPPKWNETTKSWLPRPRTVEPVVGKQKHFPTSPSHSEGSSSLSTVFPQLKNAQSPLAMKSPPSHLKPRPATEPPSTERKKISKKRRPVA